MYERFFEDLFFLGGNFRCCTLHFHNKNNVIFKVQHFYINVNFVFDILKPVLCGDSHVRPVCLVAYRTERSSLPVMARGLVG